MSSGDHGHPPRPGRDILKPRRSNTTTTTAAVISAPAGHHQHRHYDMLASNHNTTIADLPPSMSSLPPHNLDTKPRSRRRRRADRTSGISTATLPTPTIAQSTMTSSISVESASTAAPSSKKSRRRQKARSKKNTETPLEYRTPGLPSVAMSRMPSSSSISASTIQSHDTHRRRRSLLMTEEDSESDCMSIISQSSAQYSSSASTAPIRRGRVFKKVGRDPQMLSTSSAVTTPFSLSPLDSNVNSRYHSPLSSRYQTPFSSRSSSVVPSRSTSPHSVRTVVHDAFLHDNGKDESKLNKRPPTRSEIMLPSLTAAVMSQTPSTATFTMDLPISKSKKRQIRRRKLRESRRESGEEADEEEAGYSHANEGESDTQDLSFDLAIPAITFKFNKAASRARVDSLYPLYDSSCASSPSKTVNNVQSNVASRPQSNNYTTRNGSGRSQGTVVSNSVLPTELPPFLLLSSAHSSETDTSQETVVPAGVEFDRENDNRFVQPNERQERTKVLPSTTTFSLMGPVQEWRSPSMSTTPTLAGKMRPTVISFAGSIDTQLDPSIEGELLMTPPPSATLGSMQPHNSGPPRASLFAGSPSTDDENTDEDQPSLMTELSMAPTPDISPVLVPSVVPGLPSVSIVEPDHVARSSLRPLPSSPITSTFVPPLAVAESTSPLLLLTPPAAAQVPLPPSPFAVVSATFEDPLPRSPVSTLDDITAAAATATVPLPASPDKDTEIETIAFAHVPPSFEAEEGKDCSLARAVGDEPHLHLPCPSSVPPAAASPPLPSSPSVSIFFPSSHSPLSFPAFRPHYNETSPPLSPRPSPTAAAVAKILTLLPPPPPPPPPFIQAVATNLPPITTTTATTATFSFIPPPPPLPPFTPAQPTLVQESLPTIATSSLPPLPPFAAPGSSHVVTPPATSNIPLPPPPPPFISASGAAAAATATAPAPVVTPSVDNTSGIPPPPPPPPSPGLTGLKKSGPRTPLQISTSIMTTLDSHPPVHGPSLTAPLTPTRSIVARHVLRWDALSHGDISQTVFDTDHHHHHNRHRRHHGHGHRGHIRQASTVPNTPTSLKSPDFLCLDAHLPSRWTFKSSKRCSVSTQSKSRSDSRPRKRMLKQR
ncbi:hypothetical protein BKA57DRAFT_83464 [Linnemannia elongata]|nr:hypothetical protein BKA57DRAFT_83464 [Linnemannia elongata]